MLHVVSGPAARFRMLVDRLLRRLGLNEDAFLVLLAVLIGLTTAAAAVAFHELIDVIRHWLYAVVGPKVDLYHKGLWLLVLLPALGGLAVGVITVYILRIREGHGIVDVLEQVSRTSGMINPLVALEKILTSAITIGSGGSAGAEGPIVQIGAGISSGFGRLFRVSRQHMPVLIGCGSAAGISAIFNSPIGGVLFTLEVVLRDFSLRTFTPLIVASVLANFATQGIFRNVFNQPYNAIFNMPPGPAIGFRIWHLGNFAVLGLICGVVGVGMTRLMAATEHQFAHLRAPKAIKPAIGGAGLGLLGVIYILVFGKVIPPGQYSMPAFFGDGYGAVLPMLTPEFYSPGAFERLLVVLAFLIALKIIGTCLTLGSGGAGGIIAPSLFLGAVTGALVGLAARHLGLSTLEPHVYALVGLGAVLAAVVHAPLAAILILLEVTRDYQIVVPAMLATILATATARLIFRDSIYTMALRKRGVRLGTAANIRLLERMTVEQVTLEPAVSIRASDPLQYVMERISQNHTSDFVVLDNAGQYIGMITGDEVRAALLDREAVPLLLVSEIMRSDIPVVGINDDLASVLDLFAVHDVPRLPVALNARSPKVVGLISRAALMKRYQMAVSQG